MSNHRYRVLVYGRNFRLVFEEGRRSVVRQTGFYTWRNVLAADSRQAEYKAMEMIRGDNRLKDTLRNTRSDPPGRPRSLTLAPDRRIPQDIRRAIRQRYGAG